VTPALQRRRTIDEQPEATVAGILKEHFDSNDYDVSDMERKHLRLWNVRQLQLTTDILKRIERHIDDSSLADHEKEELTSLLNLLCKVTLPLFVAGMDANPIHHNVQVAENMLLIVTANGGHDYAYVRKAVVLALLHDIGNGFVDPNLSKIKSSDIRDLRDELTRQGKTEEEINSEVEDLIEKAKAYRKAHMLIGADIAGKLLIALEGSPHFITLNPRDIEHIKKSIEQHDNPSIAQYDSDLDRPVDAGNLIPLDDPLAYDLREADRLWMISKEGLAKDLHDDLEKGKALDALAKLKHNVERFKEEVELYEKATGSAPDQIDPEQLKAFKKGTLFRSEAAFELFQRYASARLAELRSTLTVADLLRGNAN